MTPLSFGPILAIDHLGAIVDISTWFIELETTTEVDAKGRMHTSSKPADGAEWQQLPRPVPLSEFFEDVRE